MANKKPDREPDLRLEMYSQPRLLAAARALVSNFAMRLGFNEAESSQISLALDEALCNVIKHGYEKRPDGRIWLSLWNLDSIPPSLRVLVQDRAHQVDPESIRGRDLDDVRPGGLGVYIMREVMDEVIFSRREGGGMELIMTKRSSGEECTKPPSQTSAREGDSPS